MHRRAVAAQNRVAHAVHIHDDGGHRVAVFGAGRDRLADRLVRQRGRESMLRDQALRQQRRPAEQACDRDSGGNAASRHEFPPVSCYLSNQRRR
jgi:hypothetical protein